jgi:hypothetical protein
MTKKTIGLIASIIAATAMLGACGETQGDRTVSGGAIGAGTGAVIGAACCFLVGAIPGALVGGAVGAGTGAVTSPNQIDLGEPTWRDRGGQG